MDKANTSHSPGPGKRGTVVLFGEVLADVFPDRSVLGGAPFNVACHLRGFGQNPVLLSRLGNDALRNQVLDTMEIKGLEVLGVQTSHRYPTGRVKVHVRNGKHRFEILPMQAYDFIHSAMARMAALSVHPQLVYFGTLAQRHEVSRRALRALLRSTKAPRFLDINLREPWYDEKLLRQSLQAADTLKLNDDELAELAQMFELGVDDSLEQARMLIERFDLSRIVVTCGERGAWQIGQGGRKVESGAAGKLKKMVDTVGAGDGFAAVYILGTLKRWPLERTLQRANAFAGAICGIRGAIPDDAGFYEPFSKAWEL